MNPLNMMPKFPIIGRVKNPASPENILDVAKAAQKLAVEKKIFKRFKFSRHREFQEKALSFLEDEWGIEEGRKGRVNFIQFKGGVFVKHIPLHDGLLFNRDGTKEWFRFDLFKDEDGTLYCECVKCLDWSSLDGPGDNNSTNKTFYYAQTSLNAILKSTAKAMRLFGEFNIINNNCITFVNKILDDLDVSSDTGRNVLEFFNNFL